MIEWPYEDAAELLLHGNPIFGDGWEGTHRGNDPDRCEVETPVGEICLLCSEPVQEDDTGEIAMYLGKRTLRIVPQHRECVILVVMGHEVGVCGCTDFAGLSIREAGIEATRRLQELRKQG